MKQKNPALAFIAIGFELVGLILASLYIGQVIDGHFSIAPWGTLGLVVLGVVGWMIHIFILLQQIDGQSQ
jgi:F0F1-type ATP synthase assembly protein I